MARRKNEQGVEIDDEVVPEVAMNVTTTQTLGLSKPEIVLSKEETEAEADKAVPTIAPAETKNGLVMINPNFTGRIYIGSRWWDFEAEKRVNVPDYVKEVLYRQKGLAPV